jgi:hypothetical protein
MAMKLGRFGTTVDRPADGLLGLLDLPSLQESRKQVAVGEFEIRLGGDRPGEMID